jgi:hypothetical protein
MNGDVYKVIVSNPSGSVSQETRLSVITAPQIVVRPENNYRIFTGTSLSIVVNATGGDVYYIWRHNDVLLQVRKEFSLKSRTFVDAINLFFPELDSQYIKDRKCIGCCARNILINAA